MALFKFLILILMSSLGSATAALPTPRNLWPLTNLTFAWDVALNLDAVHPNRMSCPEFLETGPPNFNFLAFLFDRSSDSFVKVTTADLGQELTTATFTFLLYLDQLTSGLVFEYNDLNDDEGSAITPSIPSLESVQSLVLELQDGRPYARIYDGENNLVTSVTSSVTLTPRTWTWVAVRWDGDAGILSVQVGLETTQKAIPSGTSSSPPISVGKGTIQMGRHLLHGTHTSFSGRLCCFFLFDVIVDITSLESELNSAAQPANWPYPAPEVKKGCPVGVAYTGPPFVHLWPLSNASFGYDVIFNTQPLAPSDYKCMRSRAGSSITNRPLVYFDGSQLSYLDASFGHGIFDEAMVSFQVFLHPDDPVEGVVWDYRLTPGYTGVGFQRMTLTLNGGIPMVQFFDENGQCGSVINREGILPDSWTMVYLIMNKGTSKVVIFTLTEGGMSLSSSGLVACPALPSKAPANATLTIGSANTLTLEEGTGEVGYRGKVACLAVLNGLVDRASAFSTLLSQCVSRDQPGLSEDTEHCLASPAIRERKFVKAADDRSPERLDPLECRPGSSLIVCSNSCSSRALCRAFTHRLDQSECCLYDYVTQAGLQEDMGSAYYVVLRF